MGRWLKISSYASTYQCSADNGPAHCEHQVVEGSGRVKGCFWAVYTQAKEWRGSGDPVSSLLLLEWLCDQGVENSYVYFHQIAALLDLNRYTEAILVLQALSALDQGDAFDAASDALKIHLNTLVANIKAHCLAQFLKPVALDLLENVPAIQIYERLFSFVRQQISAGGTPLAKAVLEELMQWGVWKLDDLPLDLQQRWAALVVELGEQCWDDLPSYRDALQRLNGTESVSFSWQRLVVELMRLQDMGNRDEVMNLAFDFLLKYPGHRVGWDWLAAQQVGVIQDCLPGASADRVLAVDQALARDESMLVYLRKLADSMDFSSLI